MKQLKKISLIALLLLCCTAIWADKRDGMATIIMKDGSRLENVKIRVPKFSFDKKVEINDGQKRTIDAKNIERMFVWSPDAPNDKVEMAYTQCYEYKKNMEKKPVSGYWWFILVTKGKNVSHWICGKLEIHKDAIEMIYPSLNVNYFWKNGDEGPCLMTLDSPKRCVECMTTYLADDPSLCAALETRHKDFYLTKDKIVKGHNILSNKYDVSQFNQWDYSLIVSTYSPKR